jgi:hypothetical protein
MAPGRNPINALGPKRKPRAKGVTVTCVRKEIQANRGGRGRVGRLWYSYARKPCNQA